LGSVTAEYGFDRWVELTVGSGTTLKAQIGSDKELATFLLQAGLQDQEAADVARRLWAARPKDADFQSVRSMEGWRSTGLSAGTFITLAVVSPLIVVAFVLLITFLLRHG